MSIDPGYLPKTDIERSIEEDSRAMNRIATSFEQIADLLDAWYKLEQARFDRDYPVKNEPRDAIVTRVPTADDLTRQNQGASEEATADWLTLGPREAEFVKRKSPEGSKRPAVEDKSSGENQS